MQEKMKFREALQEVMQIAESNGNKITKKEAECCLEEFSLSEEQKELVYSYLEAQKIAIEGHESAGENPFKDGQEEAEELSEEDKGFLEEYLEMAKGQELERNMAVCAEVAVRFAGRGIPLADLIQEGSIGLLMALDTLELRDDDISEEEYIRTGIQGAIESLLDEEAVQKESDDRILEKINYIAEAIRNLTEELERKVSLEELSAYLEMDGEEIAEILKLTGEEIEAGEPKPETEDTVGYADIGDFKIF